MSAVVEIEAPAEAATTITIEESTEQKCLSWMISQVEQGLWCRNMRFHRDMNNPTIVRHCALGQIDVLSGRWV